MEHGSREEFLKMLFGALSGDRDNNKNLERKHIRALTPREKDELKCMKIESAHLCKERERISEEHDALMARRELFWYHVKRSLGSKRVPHLEIDDADENICEVIHPDRESEDFTNE